MADVTLNTVLYDEHEPRIGDRYEVAPGKWGTMKSPTMEMQEKALEIVGREGATDMEIVRLALDGDLDFNDKSAIHGMPAKVTQDFFTLLLRTAERLTKE